MKKKVIVAQKAAPELLNQLQEAAEVIQLTEGDMDTLKEHLPTAEAIILGTWLKFNQELMDLSPKLRVISRTGVGVDNVDVDAASQRGILVLNTPKANAISVAEHAVTLICSLSKHILTLDYAVRHQNFKIRRQNLPVDIDGKTLGLVGLGNIGRIVAEKCRMAFNMEIIAYDPYVTSAPDYIKIVSTLEDLYEASDFISIHLPLTDSTRHLIDEKAIEKMKKSAYLINTSRGGIIDEDALCKALEEGLLAGAGLDVFENEPPSEDSPVLTCDKLILTPHSAALTKECTLRVAQCAFQGVLDYLKGNPPEYIFNKNKLSSTR